VPGGDFDIEEKAMESVSFQMRFFERKLEEG
jgi:hypothetical protein